MSSTTIELGDDNRMVCGSCGGEVKLYNPRAKQILASCRCAVSRVEDIPDNSAWWPASESDTYREGGE